MATEIKAFKCDWCPRCFTRRNNAELHEAACKNNPKRRQCITCVHGTVDELKIPTPRPWAPDDFYTTTTAPYCAIYKMPIHAKPYFIECDIREDGNSRFSYDEEFPDSPPIPGTCWNYEYKGKPGWTKKQRMPTEEERRTYL
ncbi:MAG: hypothetical protein ACOX63_03215 [Christensenellales bacterium]|jgi:hypothetical protein